ncbi:MAG: hypothetical protein HY781_09635 [Chloroflexi bacterium]|nr:hypothetical protein [Chloroflexota bacterium]
MKKKLTVIFGLIGFGLAGFAIFANRFGFDPENDWEIGRVNVAVSGILIIVLFFIMGCWGLLMSFFEMIKGKVNFYLSEFFQWLHLQRFGIFLSSKMTALRSRWGHTSFVRWYQARVKTAIASTLTQVRKSRFFCYFSASKSRMAALAAVILGGGVMVIYVWYISLGFWDEWPTTTTYYYKLADAFWHRQTNLLLEPHPELLALADPYQVENRQGFPYLWDAVLYNGKYYLYWGPAPALLLTVVRFFYSGEIGDHLLGFGFILGEFLVSVLLLLKMRSKFFEDLCWPYIVPGILMAGLANPILWMLNRAAVYEAAIAGGQFFLMTGFYLAFLSIENQKTNYWGLFFAGFSLVLAMASRMSIALAAFFLFMMIIWNLFRKPVYSPIKTILSFFSLSIPFVAGVLGLGWYNKTRFGSWFEFGHRYQLTTMNQNALFDQILSWANVPINFYNYLFNPFSLNSTFPYIYAYWGSHFVVFPIHNPKYYFVAEPVSGLLLSVPYVLFATISVLFLVREGGKVLVTSLQRRQGILKSPNNHLLLWTLFTLSGMSALSFAPILLFFAATMRYLADVVPSLLLLATLGCWIGWKELENRPSHKRGFWTLVIVLVVISAVISSLLAVTGLDFRLEKVNPAVYYRLVEMFSFGIR